MACNLDVLPTVLEACQVVGPANLSGVDLRDREAVVARDTLFLSNFSHDMIAPALAKPAGEASQLDFTRGIRHSTLLCGISEHRAMPGCNNTYQPQTVADYAIIGAA